MYMDSLRLIFEGMPLRLAGKSICAAKINFLQQLKSNTNYLSHPTQCDLIGITVSELSILKKGQKTPKLFQDHKNGIFALLESVEQTRGAAFCMLKSSWSLVALIELS